MWNPTRPLARQACAPANGPASALAAIIFSAALLAPTLAAAAGSVSIESPWIRFIIRATPAAGYFTLKNDSDKTVELTGASSTGCGMVMLHETKQINGVEHMLMVKSFKVPAHRSLSFAPGGYHLMCMQPQNSMKVGASVPVTLKFADGKTLTAQFPVKGPGGK
jgi:periplasmic copper chaperone A